MDVVLASSEGTKPCGATISPGFVGQVSSSDFTLRVMAKHWCSKQEVT